MFVHRDQNAFHCSVCNSFNVKVGNYLGEASDVIHLFEAQTNLEPVQIQALLLKQEVIHFFQQGEYARLAEEAATEVLTRNKLDTDVILVKFFRGKKIPETV